MAENGLELLGYCNGKTLSRAERAAIQCSLPHQQKKYNGTIKFWGKLYGSEGDYLILVVTLPQFERTFLYSVDGGLNWSQIQSLTEEQQKYSRLITMPYKGNPVYEYKFKEELPPDPVEIAPIEAQKPEGEEEVEEEEEKEEEEKEEAEEEKEENAEKLEDEEEQEVVKPKKPRTRDILIAESIRLSHYIREVDVQCRTIPRDIHKGGLGVDEALDLQNYIHDRTDGGPLSADQPKGVWTCKRDPISGVVRLYNLLYDGFVFLYQPQSRIHSQYYFGNGLRSVNLCFMIY